MNIFQCLPRQMTFSRKGASSVELCVSEWMSKSRFREGIHIIAEAGNDPLIDIDVLRLKPAKRLSSFDLAFQIRQLRKRLDCALILTQQHIPTAARIALANGPTPVVLQTHNYIDPPKAGALGGLANFIRRRELKTLGGITFISEATRRDFETRWPGLNIPGVVVSNGFNFAEWSASLERDKTIICVGRVMPEKGLVETAEALKSVLARHPDWSALFMLSRADANPAYFAQVQALVAEAGERCRIVQNIPYAEVKAISERAAIAVVASKWNEPFGRTALEAHAAGCALISSGSGGLREISGEHAVYLDDVSAPAIERALETLIEDEPLRRRMTEGARKRTEALFRLEADGSEPPSICQKLDDFVASLIKA
jgi:glycosyltransferase involved in cell wall biosynthesis